VDGGKVHAREGMLRHRHEETAASILYVNSVGLQNNGKNLVWFDGDSCFINAEGTIAWRAPRLKKACSSSGRAMSASLCRLTGGPASPRYTRR